MKTIRQAIIHDSFTLSYKKKQVINHFKKCGCKTGLLTIEPESSSSLSKREYSDPFAMNSTIAYELTNTGFMSFYCPFSSSLFANTALEFASNTKINGMTFGTENSFHSLIGKSIRNLSLTLDIAFSNPLFYGLALPQPVISNAHESVSFKNEKFKNFTVFFEKDPSLQTLDLKNEIQRCYKLKNFDVSLENQKNISHVLDSVSGDAIYIRPVSFDQTPFSQIENKKYPVLFLPICTSTLNEKNVTHYYIEMVCKSGDSNKKNTKARTLFDLRDLIFFASVIAKHFPNYHSMEDYQKM